MQSEHRLQWVSEHAVLLLAFHGYKIAVSGNIIAEREARQVIESQCRFCIYICCNAGRSYIKRAGLNQYERRAGHPCNLRARGMKLVEISYTFQ